MDEIEARSREMVTIDKLLMPMAGTETVNSPGANSNKVLYK